MVARAPKIGDLVLIRCLDHCFVTGGATEPLPVKVVGWLVAIEKDHYKLAPWVTEEMLISENSDSYTILKHKGLKINRVREWPKK